MSAQHTSPRSLPITPLIGMSLFFNGVIFASTLNYGAIVGIDTLGIPNATYAVVLMASSLAGAAASVILGWLSDRVRDRRLLVVACALTGAIGFGAIYLIRDQLSFILVTCAVMPFAFAIFSQIMAHARVHLTAAQPGRADFMISALRTVFAVAWAIVPPFVGILAATTSVFEIYAVAAAAFLVIAAIYLVMLWMDRAAWTAGKAGDAGAATVLPTGMEVDPAIAGGTVGWLLIAVAVQITTVTAPLLVTNTLGGGYDQLGIYAGLAAALELPFIILWGYVLRWVKKHTVIIAAAMLYAIYLGLLSQAQSVADVLWLQLINGPATAALVSIPISYMQEAIRGRVGLSTSLLDVVRVVAVLSSAAIFGGVTAVTPDYPMLFVIAAILSLSGAVAMFAAHRVLRSLPPEPAGTQV